MFKSKWEKVYLYGKLQAYSPYKSIKKKIISLLKCFFFQLLKSLSLEDQFKSFVVVFERTTFSSFKFWMSNFTMHLLYPLPLEY